MRHPTLDWMLEDGSRPTVRAQARLLLKGKGKKEGHIVVGQWEPYCDAPVPVSFAAPRGTGGYEVNMKAPCRKCPKCLQYRSMHWRERALSEVAKTAAIGRRTWLVTLTFSPPHLAGILMEAKASGDGSLKAIDRCAYAHVRGYLDRVRKAGYPFRYLAVFERGERTGRAHYHLLMHEGPKGPILKRTLETRWRSHVHARLVGDGTERGMKQAATYVCKYATKASEIKLRASQRYGMIEAR